MRIWHLNVGNYAGRVDGVAMMSSGLANAQAAAGHDVHLWVATDPEHRQAVIDLADDGVQLQVHASAKSSFAAMIASLDDPRRTPDVVHAHSVFRPVHALFAAVAERRRIPVVQTPHAGLDPLLLSRDRARKSAYRWLVERRSLCSASAVVALQRLEAVDVRRFSGRRKPVDIIANPVDSLALGRPGWRGPDPDAPPVALMLSRYDVFQKGLDRMVAMAEELPHVEFRVHGSQDKNDPERTRSLRSVAPPNVHFLPPVYDTEKYEALEAASVFLMPSRAEGLSLALTEAMTVGVPCAVSTFVDRSLDLSRHEAALALQDDPVRAAARLREFLADPIRMRQVGLAGARFAAERFAPDRICEAYLEIYARVRADAVEVPIALDRRVTALSS